MTYCLGIRIDEGLVIASDSRTNAGVDYVSIYSKMYRFELSPDRIFVIVTSGNLATSQAVIKQLERDLDDPNAFVSLRTVRYLFDAASYLGQVSQQVQEQYANALNKSGINGESYFIIGGKIGDEPHDLHLVYAQGNCISPPTESPFLQIGETKYGKPILDRVIRPDTDLDDAARAALVSLDSTIRSNITVGPPLELVVIRANEYTVSHYFKLEEQDNFYQSIKAHWNEGLQHAFKALPRFPWESILPAEQPQQQVTPVPQPQAIPGASPDARQPQELSQQAWTDQLG